jgi:hypothetical protein
MRDGTDKSLLAGLPKPPGLRAPATICLLAVLLLSAARAFAQNAQTPAAAPDAAATQAVGAQQPVPPATAPAAVAPQAQGRGLFPIQPPPPAERPGFIYAFGRWWDNTRSKFQDVTKPPNDAAEGAAAATKDAVNGAVDATKGAASATGDALKNAAQATKDAANALFKLPGTRVVEVFQRCAIAPNGAPDCRTAASSACRAKGFSSGNPVDVQSSQNCPPAVWMSGREPSAGECPEETVVLMAACQ